LVLVGADPEGGQSDRAGKTGGLAVSWQWLLQPLDDGRRTRLIARQRYDYPGRQRLLWQLVNPIDFAMERRMLKSIKARAETAALSGADHQRY
jgi:hypothetical protein